MLVCMYVCLRMCVCVSVCVRERERESIRVCLSVYACVQPTSDNCSVQIGSFVSHRPATHCHGNKLVLNDSDGQWLEVARQTFLTRGSNKVFMGRCNIIGGY